MPQNMISDSITFVTLMTINGVVHVTCLCVHTEYGYENLIHVHTIICDESS